MNESTVFAAMNLKKRVEHGKANLNKHIGHSWSQRTIDFLDYLENEWSSIVDSELDEEFSDSELFEKVVRQELSWVLTKAVKNGNVSQIKYITGYSPNREELSSIGLVKKLLNRITREGYCAYIFGKVGVGKTDFALLLSEIWKLNDEGEVGLNIESFEEKDQLIRSFSELKKWLEKSGEKLFVFDEASSYAGGYGEQGYRARNLVKLLKRFRKYDASLLIIGHTGKDVHPEIRRSCHDVIEKVGKKKARFWEKLKDGEGKGLELEIDDIPKTGYSYDTDELTQWSWE